MKRVVRSGWFIVDTLVLRAKEGRLYVFKCWKALLKYFEQHKSVWTHPEIIRERWFDLCFSADW